MGKLQTTLSTKGQVILPKQVRDSHNWKPGTKLIVEDTPEGVLLKVMPLFKPTTLDEVVGSLRYDGPAMTAEEMDEGIVKAVSEDWARFERD